MRVLNKQHWPHRVEVEHNFDADGEDDVEQWLRLRVGEQGQEWTQVRHLTKSGADYYFRNRANAVMFALKWAQ
jgi:hypothetical protein